MYVVIVEYPFETVVKEVQTKSEVKAYVEENKRDALNFDIYRVSKKLSVDDLKTSK